MPASSKGANGSSRLHVPGRLCLLGEHSDWLGALRTERPSLATGRCLVASTDQGLSAKARPAKGRFVMKSVGESTSLSVAMDVDALQEVAEGAGFYSHAAGVAAELLERYAVDGLELEVTSADLPKRKGLSSSAAACVLVARAFSQAHGLDLSWDEEMDLAFEGERRAKSACGRMDQVCARGAGVTSMSFDGARVAMEPVSVGGPFHLLIVDLAASKDTRRILDDLQRCVAEDAPSAPGLEHALGAANQELVQQGIDALAEGSPRRLGELMTEAQALFDAEVAPASAELRAPQLHALLDREEVKALSWGGKGVGSQGDGCAQFVSHGPEERDALSEWLASSRGLLSFPLTLNSAPSGPSA